MPDISLEDLQVHEGWGGRLVRDATRLDLLQALGLVSVCTTCLGDGFVWVPQSRAAWSEKKSCPDCVDGLVVSPEAVERVKAQLLHYLDDELFLNLEEDLDGIVDWAWVIGAGLRAALGLGGTG